MEASPVALTRSPIREAVFDVRFKFEKEFDVTVFEKAHEQIIGDFPRKEISLNNTFSILIEPKEGVGPSFDSTSEPHGFRFFSTDGTRVAQFRKDGFTFSQLKPYKSWPEFIAEARKMLDLYLTLCTPSYAERIALRYINAIEISERVFNPEEYFSSAPTIPPALPQDMVNFFYRLMVKDDVSDALAIVNQTIEVQTHDKSVHYIFDIDVFFDGVRLEAGSPEFWDSFEILKKLRTRIFFNSLTEKTRTMLL